MKPLCALFAAAVACAQTNYDESKVGTYTLPDPLTMNDGRPVRDAAAWKRERRPEILGMFETNMQGRGRGKLAGTTFELAETDRHALDGKAIRKQVTASFGGHKMDILIYLPAAAAKPVPVFLCLNFTGNHKILTDPAIKLSEVWDAKTKTKHTAPPESRATSTQFQVDAILARGFGLATIYYQDLEPDFSGGMQYGIRPLFFKPGQTAPRAGRLGIHRRVGLGLEPRPGLSGDRQGRGRQARDRHGTFAAGENFAVGRRAGPAVRDGDRRRIGRGWRGAQPPQLRRNGEGHQHSLPALDVGKLPQVRRPRGSASHRFAQC